MELSWPVGVQHQGHLPICPLGACPWAINMSNLGPMVSRLCGTHIPKTAWRIYSIRSSIGLSWPVVVQQHGHLPIRPLWACPWAKNFIFGTAAWIFSIRNSFGLSWPVVVERQAYLTICHLWACPWALACPWAKNLISGTAAWIFSVRNSIGLSWPAVVQCQVFWPFAPYGRAHGHGRAHGRKTWSLEPLHGFSPFEILLDCLDM